MVGEFLSELGEEFRTVRASERLDAWCDERVCVCDAPFWYLIGETGWIGWAIRDVIEMSRIESGSWCMYLRNSVEERGMLQGRTYLERIRFWRWENRNEMVATIRSVNYYETLKIPIVEFGFSGRRRCIVKSSDFRFVVIPLFPPKGNAIPTNKISRLILARNGRYPWKKRGEELRKNGRVARYRDSAHRRLLIRQEFGFHSLCNSIRGISRDIPLCLVAPFNLLNRPQRSRHPPSAWERNIRHHHPQASN